MQWELRRKEFYLKYINSLSRKVKLIKSEGFGEIYLSLNRFYKERYEMVSHVPDFLSWLISLFRAEMQVSGPYKGKTQQQREALCSWYNLTHTCSFLWLNLVWGDLRHSKDIIHVVVCRNNARDSLRLKCEWFPWIFTLLQTWLIFVLMARVFSFHGRETETSFLGWQAVAAGILLGLLLQNKSPIWWHHPIWDKNSYNYGSTVNGDQSVSFD